MRTPRPAPTLWLPYTLAGVVLAQLAMTAVGADRQNHDAYLIGLALSGALGASIGAVGARASALARHTWTVASGALAGAGILVLVSGDSLRQLARSNDYLMLGLAVLGCAGLGALVALVVVFVETLGSSLQGAVPADDARERTMMPFAATSCVAGAIVLTRARGVDRYVAAGFVALAALALVEILLRDRRRVQYVTRVLAGTEPGLEVVELRVPRPEIPLLVGGATAEVLVLERAEYTHYREAAQRPLFAIARLPEQALAPLRQRTRIILAAHVATLVIATAAIAYPPLRGLEPHEPQLNCATPM